MFKDRIKLLLTCKFSPVNKSMFGEKFALMSQFKFSVQLMNCYIFTASDSDEGLVLFKMPL